MHVVNFQKLDHLGAHSDDVVETKRSVVPEMPSSIASFLVYCQLVCIVLQVLVFVFQKTKILRGRKEIRRFHGAHCIANQLCVLSS